MSTAPQSARGGSSALAVVAGQELREAWLGGRALLMTAGFSALLGVIAYLTASNAAVEFLEQRESVGLTLQVAIGLGSLLALLAAADTFAGERERGTLESLLLTPASRLELTAGKLLAALSLWLAAFAITVPYLWFLGRGIGVTGAAIAAGFVVGTLLAVFLASLATIISVFAGSNRVSLSFSLVLLLALFAPTRLPASAQQGWGEQLVQVIPVTAGDRFLTRIVVDGEPWSESLTWLVAPIAGAVLFAVLALVAGSRFLRLRGGA